MRRFLAGCAGSEPIVADPDMTPFSGSVRLAVTGPELLRLSAFETGLRKAFRRPGPSS
jgi:hypothetical protein